MGRLGGKSKQQLLLQSIQEEQQLIAIKDVLGQDLRGTLSDDDAVQFALTNFPASANDQRSLPNQAGVDTSMGLTTTISQDQLNDLDNRFVEEYTGATFNIGRTNDGQLQITHPGLEGRSVPALIPQGFDYPVAIASSEQDVELFKNLNIPYVTDGKPHEVHIDPDTKKTLEKQDDSFEAFDVATELPKLRQDAFDQFNTVLDWEEQNLAQKKQMSVQGKIGSTSLNSRVCPEKR